MKLFDSVRLLEAQDEVGLPAGSLGVIVLIHGGLPPAFEVEFVDEKGRTLALIPLSEENLELYKSS